ncbi:hypothetical protein CsSME_00053294 [Camellia sinensis var. sinensis]
MCRWRGLGRFSRSFIDREKLYDTITITDGQSSQSIYNRSRDHYEFISPGQTALLTSLARSISTCDSFTIDVALKDKDNCLRTMMSVASKYRGTFTTPPISMMSPYTTTFLARMVW